MVGIEWNSINIYKLKLLQTIANFSFRHFLACQLYMYIIYLEFLIWDGSGFLTQATTLATTLAWQLCSFFSGPVVLLCAHGAGIQPQPLNITTSSRCDELVDEPEQWSEI